MPSTLSIIISLIILLVTGYFISKISMRENSIYKKESYGEYILWVVSDTALICGCVSLLICTPILLFI